MENHFFYLKKNFVRWLFGLACFLPFFAKAQTEEPTLINNGGLVVANGGGLYVNGNVVNLNGTLDVQEGGVLEIEGFLLNLLPAILLSNGEVRTNGDFINDGADIILSNKMTMLIQGNFENRKGTIDLQDATTVLQIGGNFTLQKESMVYSAGKIQVKGDFFNHSQYSTFIPFKIVSSINNGIPNTVSSPRNGTFVFEGTKPQKIGGSRDICFTNVLLNNPTGLTLQRSICVNNALTFQTGNLDLNGFDILLGLSGFLSAERNESRIFSTVGGYVKADHFLFAQNQFHEVRGLGIEVKIENNSEITSARIWRGHTLEPIPPKYGVSRFYRIETNAAQPNKPNPIIQVRFNYFDNEIFGGKGDYQMWQSKDDGIKYQVMPSQVNSPNQVESKEQLDFGTALVSRITLGADKCFITADNFLGDFISSCQTMYFIDTGLGYFSPNDRKIVSKYHFKWSHNGIVFDEGILPFGFITANGLYEVVISDPVSGCVISDAVEVSLGKPIGNFFQTVNQKGCEKLVLKPDFKKNLNTEYTYLWSTGEKTESITVTKNGNYSLEVSMLGCKGKSFVTAEIFPKFEVNLGKDQVLCTDGKIEFDAGVEGTYLWSTGETTRKIEVKKAGTYSVKVKNLNTCEAESNKVKVSQSEAKVELPAAKSICEGETLTLSAPTGTGLKYAWSTGETTSKITVNKAGEYSLKVTQGDCVAEGSTKVSLIPLPTITQDALVEICEGEKVLLKAGEQAEKSTISWTKQGKVIGTKSEIEISEAGNYALTVTTSEGCKNEKGFSVAISQKMVLGLPKKMEKCGNFVIDASYNLSEVQKRSARYLWSDGSTDEFLRIKKTGVYSVKVKADNFCQTEEQISVTIADPPILLDLGKDRLLCKGEKISIDGTIPNETGLSYIWSVGSTLADLQILGINPILEIKAEDAALKSGKATYKLSVNKGKDCSVEDRINIKVDFNPPKVEIPAEQYLCSDKAAAYLDAGKEGEKYEWTASNGFRSSKNAIWVSQEGEYKVGVTGKGGCLVNRTVVVRRAKREQETKARFLGASPVEEGALVVFVNLSNPQTAQFTWNFGDKSTSEEMDPKHGYAKEGTYKTTLVAKGTACADTLYKTISVIKKPGRNETLEPSAPQNGGIISHAKVFPNPNEGVFMVEIETVKPTRIEMVFYNSLGIKVLSKSQEASFSLSQSVFNFRTLPSGVYYLRIVAENEVQTIRFVRE